MLRTIQFDYKLSIGTEKIHNVISNDLLPLEYDREFFQKIIPKVAFFLGHVFS